MNTRMITEIIRMGKHISLYKTNSREFWYRRVTKDRVCFCIGYLFIVIRFKG